MTDNSDVDRAKAQGVDPDVEAPENGGKGRETSADPDSSSESSGSNAPGSRDRRSSKTPNDRPKIPRARTRKGPAKPRAPKPAGKSSLGLRDVTSGKAKRERKVAKTRSTRPPARDDDGRKSDTDKSASRDSRGSANTGKRRPARSARSSPGRDKRGPPRPRGARDSGQGSSRRRNESRPARKTKGRASTGSGKEVKRRVKTKGPRPDRDNASRSRAKAEDREKAKLAGAGKDESERERTDTKAAKAEKAKTNGDKAPSVDAGAGKKAERDARSSDPGPKKKKKREKKPLELRLKLYGCTDVGQVREHNEDNFLVADLSNVVVGPAEGTKVIKVGPHGVLMAVCDGMGGAAAGEIASQLAVDIIHQRMASRAGHQNRDQLAMDIVEALEEAGVRILNESNKNRACRGMGTTATVAALVDDVLLLGQVGDSRAYILRDKRLVQVTRDQSLVNQLIEAGQLTEEEAENFEHSNIILQALGTADAVQVDLTFVPLRRGDVLLMCSDGLSGMVRDDEIRQTLNRTQDPMKACQVLVEEANQAGGHDNVTVIVAQFEGKGLSETTPEDTEQLQYAKYELPGSIHERDSLTSSGQLEGLEDSTFDDTPSIEIHGEIELGPDGKWDELLSDRPQIPKDPGPDWRKFGMFVAVLIAVVVLLYFLVLGR